MCTRMHICKHICTYATIYAYMRAYMHVCEPIVIYARIYAYMCAYMHICIYASIYAYMREFTHICAHTCINPHIYAHMRAYINASRSCQGWEGWGGGVGGGLITVRAVFKKMSPCTNWFQAEKVLPFVRKSTRRNIHFCCLHVQALGHRSSRHHVQIFVPFLTIGLQIVDTYRRSCPDIIRLLR